MSPPDAQPSIPRPWLMLVAMLVYAVWPALAIWAGHRFFDYWWEGAIMFGGVSLFCLLPVALVLPISDTASAAFVIGVWLVAWLIAVLLFVRRPRTLQHQLLFLLLVSLASFAQAAMGLLMVLTKNV